MTEWLEYSSAALVLSGTAVQAAGFFIAWLQLRSAWRSRWNERLLPAAWYAWFSAAWSWIRRAIFQRREPVVAGRNMSVNISDSVGAADVVHPAVTLEDRVSRLEDLVDVIATAGRVQLDELRTELEKRIEEARSEQSRLWLEADARAREDTRAALTTAAAFAAAGLLLQLVGGAVLVLATQPW